MFRVVEQTPANIATTIWSILRIHETAPFAISSQLFHSKLKTAALQQILS